MNSEDSAAVLVKELAEMTEQKDGDTNSEPEDSTNDMSETTDQKDGKANCEGLAN